LDVAELTAFQSDVFVEAEDTGISELIEVNYGRLLVVKVTHVVPV
jgi:hypothetical protein